MFKSSSSSSRSSRSGSSGMAAMQDAVGEVMECPICNDISIPIYQCKNGHLLCKICWDSLVAKNCPSCRVPCGTPIRNMALERILQNCELRLPCKYAHSGCSRKMAYVRKAVHQLACPFKTYKCPLRAGNGDCGWEGKVEEMVDHLTCKRPGHAVPTFLGESRCFEFTTEFPRPDQPLFIEMQIMKCFNEDFIVVYAMKAYETDTIHVDDPLLGAIGGIITEYSAFVMCVGTAEKAKKFAYRVELERDGRRLGLESVPLCIADKVEATMDKGDCFQFLQKTMKLYRFQNADIIPVCVTITKT